MISPSKNGTQKQNQGEGDLASDRKYRDDVARFVNEGGAVTATGAHPIVEDGPFLTDIKELRRRARETIEQGAITEGYRANQTTVIKLLNEALATEIVCVLRYKRHQYMAQGLEAKAVAAEFAEHALEEQGHVDEIAHRITQLNGEPNFNPEGLLMRSHSEYVEGASLLDMILEDLVAERIAVQSYTEMIRYIADNDSTTRRMLEGILAKEEEHAQDLADLMAKETVRKT